MAEAQQRKTAPVEEVAQKAPEEKSMLKTFFSRARVLGVFLVVRLQIHRHSSREASN